MDSQGAAVRRISHYSSDMDILLVGEGDFSFAAALARAFHTAPRLLATSLDSREMLHIKYGALIIEQRMGQLALTGAVVLNDVDVTTISQHPSLRHLSFDRIIYNFPHSGFIPNVNEHTKSLIRKHRELIRAFFKHARRMLKVGGEVHVAHHMCKPYSEWRLQEQAAISGLQLQSYRKFEKKKFLGYTPRRGAGENANGSFLLRNPVTFIFSMPISCPPSQKPSPFLGCTIRSCPPSPPPTSNINPSPSWNPSISIPCPPPTHTNSSHPYPLHMSPSIYQKPRPSKSMPIPSIVTAPPPSPTIFSNPSHPPSPPLHMNSTIYQKPRPSKSILGPSIVTAPPPSPTICSNSPLPPSMSSPPPQKVSSYSGAHSPCTIFSPSLPPTTCIIPHPLQKPSCALKTITPPSLPCALSPLHSTTQPLIMTSIFDHVSIITSTSQHINSYKPPAPDFKSSSGHEYYQLSSSSDHIISESCSCITFLKWIFSCCMTHT